MFGHESGDLRKPIPVGIQQQYFRLAGEVTNQGGDISNRGIDHHQFPIRTGGNTSVGEVDPGIGGDDDLGTGTFRQFVDKRRYFGIAPSIIDLNAATIVKGFTPAL